MNKNIITIDLNRSSYPNQNHKASEELIQQDAILTFKALIDKSLNLAKVYHPGENNDVSEDKHFRRRHEAITILGERGTGKTNFLVNLKNILDNDDLFFLKTLDPTLFEDRQNILISIISMIHDKISSTFDNNAHSQEYTDYIMSLNKLAKGLNLLDGIGQNPMEKDLWDDSILILDKGLQNASSGLNFEKYFHNFIYNALQLLGKKMFLLRLDDIDTNIQKGWPVLEVIRKYLTTPQLQVVISGDWRLYSKIVRIKQWEHLYSLKKIEENNNLNVIIDSLEEQYLSKILTPNSRIFLKSLYEIVEEKKYDIVIKDTENDTHVNISEIYKIIFKDAFGFSAIYSEIYSRLLMNFPIRTNIQILTMYTKSLENNSLNKKIFIEGTLNTFLTASERTGFEYRDFHKLYGDIGYTYLAVRLRNIEKKYNVKPFEIISMEPTLENNDFNILMMLIAVVVSDTFYQKPNRIVNWFYRIEYLETIKQKSLEDVDAIMQYLSYEKNISNYDSVIKINGLLHQADKKIEGFAKLYIYTKGIPEGIEGIAYEKFIVDLAHEKGKYSIQEQNLTKFLVSLCTMKIIGKSESQTNMYVSFHYIIGFLGEMLADNFEDKFIFKVSDDTKIFAYSNHLGSHITNGDSIIKRKEDLPKIFIDDFDKWVSKKKYLESHSLMSLRAIWEEFIVSEEDIIECSNLQEYLEVQFYLFMNALIKAEAKETDKAITSRNITNKQNAGKHFMTHLQKLYNVEKKQSPQEVINTLHRKIDLKIETTNEITLLEFFLLCPLWDYYMYFHKLKIIEGENALLGTFNDEEKYFGIMEKIALHSNPNKFKNVSKKVKNNFSDMVKNIIMNNFDDIDSNNLEKSLEHVIKSDTLYKESGYKRLTQKLKQTAIQVYNKISEDR